MRGEGLGVSGQRRPAVGRVGWLTLVLILGSAAAGCGSDDSTGSRNGGAGGEAESGTGGAAGDVSGGVSGGTTGGASGDGAGGVAGEATGATAGSSTGAMSGSGTGAVAGDATGGQPSGGTGGESGSGAGGSSGAAAGGSAGSPSGGGSGGSAASAGESTGGASGGAAAGGTGGNDVLPEGANGIAARYPGDAGIDADSAVIFADDFESYAQASELNQRWDAVYQNQYVGIATDPADVYAGSQALQFILPQQTDELSDATDKQVSPEQDVLFLRYYSKFMPPYDVVGSSHNGAGISAHYFIDGQATPGVPADGTNKFLVNLENWRGEAATESPGLLNVYVYHPEQRSQWGDHFFPTGLVSPNTSLAYDFGPNFVARDDMIQALDQWYCYELMVRANTPGQRDGRIAAWVDGALVMDFMNLRFRDVESLKIDRFGLSFHIGSNPNGETRKWYDNVVAATSYIGPLASP